MEVGSNWALQLTPQPALCSILIACHLHEGMLPRRPRPSSFAESESLHRAL